VASTSWLPNPASWISLRSPSERELFYVVAPGALTLIRNRRRIREPYRINDIERLEQAVPGRDFDHRMYSGLERRKVNLEVIRFEDR
jgi:hypothetical protein